VKTLPEYRIAHRCLRLRSGADGTTWPWPFGVHQDAAWKARYAPATLTQTDMFELASIADAYATLITHPAAGVRANLTTLHRIYEHERKAGDNGE
jgi:hypothetical protein